MDGTDNTLNANDILQFLNSGGVLAILVLIVWTGRKRFWVWGWTYEEKAKQLESSEAENNRLHLLMEERLIPAVVEGTAAVKESQAMSLQLQKELDRKNGQ